MRSIKSLLVIDDDHEFAQAFGRTYALHEPRFHASSPDGSLRA